MFFKDWQNSYGDRWQELVYIGQHLPKSEMLAALEACLLTDEEMALQPTGWQKLPDPFPAWGAPLKPPGHVHV